MFRTELTIAPQERQLARTARVLTVGSCFADSIGTRLRLNKVNALVNPFGTVFQPLALAQLLRAAAGEEQDWQQHVVEARCRWQSYDFHSTIGAESPVELLQLIQETVHRVGDFARTADAVVLTLGTAWAYRLRETDELVSNLHKLPSSLFEKELLTADEIVNGLAEVHALLRRLNPSIRIVLTVSPVRHIKDTLPLNAVSKSVLRVACHYLSELLPGVSYFPAYELLTDELRDYRFYASDMLHPSEVAEDYIWDKFARAYFDADFGRFRKEWTAVRQSLGHRPLHLGAPEHRTFLDQTAERLERLGSQGVDVRQELRDVQRQLAALPPPKPVRAPMVEPDDDEERIDIGGEVEDTEAARPLAPVAQPERREDNRRNGRRNDRPTRTERDRRTQQEPIPVVPASEGELDNKSSLPTEVAADAEAVLMGAENALLPADQSTAYPAKKKKRRSRGGAKRTARKNAARLAAEQAGTEGLAAEELLEELAQEIAGITPEDEAIVHAAETDSGESAASSEASETIPQHLPENGPAQLPAVRKRGTGPTPKKSKVITKSGLVKRGDRRSLYRSPAPDNTASVDAPALPEVVPATAPIISPPIIPVALLERPAVAEAVFATPPEPIAPTEPAAPNAETPAPAKPRRGRPKAAKPATAPAIEVEATPPPAPEPETSLTRAKRPTRATKAAKPADTKPAATKKAPAKKKTAAKPAGSRRRAAPSSEPPAPETPAS
ncbi:hypothetical protein GCM10023172_41740 [Hymenobacter ginsengisoli]|uniref:GSCFA domain-containing protein n=1 Tax=Hymenobacter ginsengisoli TaxID=1051626 RepID=A0ABP8QRK4_9BACT|nr:MULTISPECIES: GSCFA domain-containing protein [unclassified Hymenobacter]MBO2032183.1 GSCFA domain-containing protein [Hymenobacter sp. BT559]